VDKSDATQATLVDRLRSFAQEQFDNGNREVWRALGDSADEIERLRAIEERAKERIRAYSRNTLPQYKDRLQMARYILEGGKDLA
jgi:hypothetical protein